MTATLYQNIRAALTDAAKAVSGMPPEAQRAYEGVPFTSTTKTPYVAFTLMPTSERPVSLGQAGMTLRQGLFQVGIFIPSGVGTGDAEALADAVKAAFVPGNTVTKNTTLVRIRYAERAQVKISPDWLQVVVTIAWDIHTPTLP